MNQHKRGNPSLGQETVRWIVDDWTATPVDVYYDVSYEIGGQTHYLTFNDAQSDLWFNEFYAVEDTLYKTEKEALQEANEMIDKEIARLLDVKNKNAEKL